MTTLALPSGRPDHVQRPRLQDPRSLQRPPCCSPTRCFWRLLRRLLLSPENHSDQPKPLPQPLPKKHMKKRPPCLRTCVHHLSGLYTPRGGEGIIRRRSPHGSLSRGERDGVRGSPSLLDLLDRRFRRPGMRIRGCSASFFRIGSPGVAAGLPIAPSAPAQARSTWICSSLTEQAAMSAGHGGRGALADRGDGVGRHQAHVGVAVLERRGQLRQRRLRARAELHERHGREAARDRVRDPRAPCRARPPMPVGVRGSFTLAAAAQAAAPVFARTMLSTPRL